MGGLQYYDNIKRKTPQKIKRETSINVTWYHNTEKQVITKIFSI